MQPMQLIEDPSTADWKETVTASTLLDEPNRLKFKFPVNIFEHSQEFLNMRHLGEVFFLDNSV